jgi:preprotein translocase subunit SecA
MDYLREGIHLRGFAQIEPLVAYKNEAFELFRDLMNSIWADFAQMVFHVQVTPVDDQGQPIGPPAPAPLARPSAASSSATGGGRVTYSGGGAPAGALAMAAAAGSAGVGNGYPGAEDEQFEPLPHVEQRRVDETQQVGRNDPCWCGSGKKFKRCHGA